MLLKSGYLNRDLSSKNGFIIIRLDIFMIIVEANNHELYRSVIFFSGEDVKAGLLVKGSNYPYTDKFI